VAPLAVVQPRVPGLHLDAPGAHVHDQIQEPVHQLHGEEVGPLLLVGRRPLLAAVAEQQQAAGLRGAEVKGDGARLLRVPPGQRQEGRRSRGVVSADGCSGASPLKSVIRRRTHKTKKP
uniref:Uncharacterized protein n=1 Tax=Takifugu rubripes TaxID=31033 RepID=A0A674PDP7_TAKRU